MFSFWGNNSSQLQFLSKNPENTRFPFRNNISGLSDPKIEPVCEKATPKFAVTLKCYCKNGLCFWNFGPLASNVFIHQCSILFRDLRYMNYPMLPLLRKYFFVLSLIGSLIEIISLTNFTSLLTPNALNGIKVLS